MPIIPNIGPRSTSLIKKSIAPFRKKHDLFTVRFKSKLFEKAISQKLIIGAIALKEKEEIHGPKVLQG